MSATTTSNSPDPVALSLGPLLYHWTAEARWDFYARIADEAEVETVYLGEVVCPKRLSFYDSQLPEVIERLQRGGKQVVLTTPAMVVDTRDCDLLRELCTMDELLIEANDPAALALLAGRPHIAGPFLNTFNEASLEYLVAQGAQRVVLPVELPRKAIALMAGAAQAVGASIEVQGFGRLPLAVSARCYHARAHGLHKDGCQFVCGLDPDGLPVNTVEGEGFLAINGIQTLSHTVHALAEEAPLLPGLGVRHLRLWPQSIDMVAVLALFRQRLLGRLDATEARTRLEALVPFAPLANGFFHDRAGVEQVSMA